MKLRDLLSTRPSDDRAASVLALTTERDELRRGLSAVQSERDLWRSRAHACDLRISELESENRHLRDRQSVLEAVSAWVASAWRGFSSQIEHGARQSEGKILRLKFALQKRHQDVIDLRISAGLADWAHGDLASREQRLQERGELLELKRRELQRREQLVQHDRRCLATARRGAERVLAERAQRDPDDEMRRRVAEQSHAANAVITDLRRRLHDLMWREHFIAAGQQRLRNEKEDLEARIECLEQELTGAELEIAALKEQLADALARLTREGLLEKARASDRVIEPSRAETPAHNYIFDSLPVEMQPSKIRVSADGDGGRDGDHPIEGVEASPLHLFGYSVGVDKEDEGPSRRDLLGRFLSAPKIEFSPDSPLRYRQLWGAGGSAQRLERTAAHLTWLIETQGKDHRKWASNAQWREDLVWLRRTFYMDGGGALRRRQAQVVGVRYPSSADQRRRPRSGPPSAPP